MKTFLTEMAKQTLPQMEPGERRAAIDALQKIIDENMFSLAVTENSEDIRACPRCGSEYFSKRGKDAAGRQRFLCKKCKRSFTTATNMAFHTTKLDRATWMRFAECHIDMLSLRDSAQRCGVCLKTAFFMRHRILESIYATIPAFRAGSGDDVELDECFFPESFKGNRKNAACGIPRRSRHRSGPADHRERICVLVGINDANDIFYEITGRGTMNESEASSVLAGKLESGAVVTTDAAKSYRNVLKDLDVRKHIVTFGREHVINRVNSVHSRLKEFIDRFHGVATRRLANYLAWFKWLWSFKMMRSSAETKELMLKYVSSNPYRTTWRNYKKTPYPFYDYWVKQARWDSRARDALALAG